MFVGVTKLAAGISTAISDFRSQFSTPFARVPWPGLGGSFSERCWSLVTVQINRVAFRSLRCVDAARVNTGKSIHGRIWDKPSLARRLLSVRLQG